MSEVTHSVGESARPRASIPPDEPERVQELVRREPANLLSLRDREAELRERAKRYADLVKRRRRLRASIQTREQELRDDKREWEEIEREMGEIRLPPGLKVSDE